MNAHSASEAENESIIYGNLFIPKYSNLIKIKMLKLIYEILKKKTEIFNRCYPTEQYIWTNLNNLMEYEFKRGPKIFTSK